MATGSSAQDVSEQFKKMGEKLGWFKHGGLDNAVKSLSQSAKKKKISKLKKIEKKTNESSKANKENNPTLKKIEPNLAAKLPSFHTPRKVKLDDFLSSDSDSSFTTIPEMATKVLPKPKIICSDSEGEEQPKEDTYISCIGESALCITVSDADGESSKANKENNPTLKKNEPKTVAKLPSFTTPRKVELDDFLSSDSDTSFTTIPELVPKVVSRPRIICSDSEGEEQPKEDTYISCIGESALCITVSDSDRLRLSKSPSGNHHGNRYLRDISPLDNCHGDRFANRNKVINDRKSFESDDYEESILRNRLSTMSLISDVDSIGDPLIESTRIHRRSSVTYKQLMASLDEEECDTIQHCPSDNVDTVGKTYKANTENKPNKHNFVNKGGVYDKIGTPTNINTETIDEVLSDTDIIAESPEVSPVKDVRYVTALEVLIDDEDKIDAKSHANYKTGALNISGSSGASSNEYVEVIDVATQTVCPDSGVKPKASKHADPVCKLYADETLDTSNTKPAYSETTVVGTAIGTYDCDIEDESVGMTTDGGNSRVGDMSVITSVSEVTSPYDQTTVSNCDIQDESLGMTTDDGSHHLFSYPQTHVNGMSVITSVSEVTSPYDQTTVSNISASGVTKKLEFTNDHTVPHDDMNIYSQITVDITSIGDRLGDKSDVSDDLDADKNVEELADSSMNEGSAVYSEISVCGESDKETYGKLENNNSSASDTSVFEVTDVGTQTEGVDGISDYENCKNSKYKTSKANTDDEINNANIDRTDSDKDISSCSSTKDNSISGHTEELVGNQDKSQNSTDLDKSDSSQNESKSTNNENKSRQDITDLDHSVPKLEYSGSIPKSKSTNKVKKNKAKEPNKSDKPKKGKVKQKVSHCFDISSDSDIDDGAINSNNRSNNVSSDTSHSSQADSNNVSTDTSHSIQADSNNGCTNTSHSSQANSNNGCADTSHSSQADSKDLRTKADVNVLTNDSDTDHVMKARTTRHCNKVKEPSIVDESILSSKTSCRDSKTHGSESSSEDNLEAFIQNLKKPDKKKSSEESTRSMKDFIVEDDEMTSETDGEVFYMTENQELDRAPLVDRLKSTRRDVSSKSEESSDDDFSSKLYPSSVTKHKQKKQQQGKSHVSSVCSSLYWESSDDEGNSKRKGKAKNRHQKSDSSDCSERNAKKGTKASNTNSKTNRKGTFQFSESDPEDDMCAINATEKQSSTTTKVKTNRKGTYQSSASDSDSENIRNQTEKETEKQSTKSVTKSKHTSKTETSKQDISLSDTDQELPLFKTPNPIRRKVTSSTGASNLPDRSSGGNTSVFKTPSIQPRSVTSFSDYISLSDDDNSSDDDSLPSLSTSSNKENVPDCQTPVRTKTSDSVFKMPTPLSTLRTPKFRSGSESSRSYSFLKSLSTNVDEGLRHPDAIKYIKNFKRSREELVKELFELYNTTIFDKQLPTDLPIIWNKRLLKTAGYCAYRCSRANKEDRTARIELSSKVCDSAERVRDTLIHELCHAAVWLLNGVNGGHGNFWRYWARHASRVHQELPTISRCHSYSINTKFTYRCTRCGYSIGRHSKSLDTSKKICGYCKGTFELIQNVTPMTPQSASSTASSVGSTPRTPNRFAMFVKDNYNSVKQKNKDLKHGDVMKELSRLFAANKINS